MTSKGKILFIAPALSMGGMERAASNTANGLHDLGYEVIFLTLFKKPHFFKLVSDIKLVEPQGFNENSLSFLKSIKFIRNTVTANNPKVVLVFNKFYGAITALALVGVKINYYLSERSSPLYEWKLPFIIVNRFAYFIRPPKGVIAQTEIAAKYQRRYFGNTKVVVIPNSVREIKLYPEIKRKNIILAVGRVNDYLKGLDLLTHAFSLLVNKTWELHIAGGDENGQSLKELAEELGISNRLKFLGEVEDIDICYAYAGIYVIPSRSEGFPNALAEAMAAGCCCVAFDFIAGPSDLIKNNEDGFLVKPGDLNALAQKIDQLILDRHKREAIGNSALKVRERLNLIKITNEIGDFIISRDQ